MPSESIYQLCQGTNSISIPPEVARVCCDSRYPDCPRQRIIDAGAITLRLCVLPAERACPTDANKPPAPYNPSEQKS